MVAPRRVLVVDDEPLVTESCRRILSEEGYSVDAAGTGREGLRRALDLAYDVVVTDLKMPDMDGLDLVRSLRRERPGQIVIVITGYGSVPSAVEAVRMGVADYIEKPFTPDEIRDAVEKVVASPGASPEASEAGLIRSVLRRASRDGAFGARLISDGSRALSGLSLSHEAKAAITTGDLSWIEATCGKLSPAERGWLDRRLSAEIW